MRVALYARVSTSDQTCEQQLTALREYCTARGWTSTTEYVDSGISGAKSKRPALDRLMKAALSRKIDCIIVWKLDRWGRSIQHLVDSLAQLSAAGVRFIATTQAIDTDTSSPAGRLMLHMLAAFAEFERDLIIDRVTAGIRRAQATGTRSGRPIGRPRIITDRTRILDLRAAGLSLSQIAAETGVERTAVYRICRENLPETTETTA